MKYIDSRLKQTLLILRMPHTNSHYAGQSPPQNCQILMGDYTLDSVIGPKIQSLEVATS